MVGIVPILGILASLLGQNLDLLGIPKTCKSVGISNLEDSLCLFLYFAAMFPTVSTNFRHIQLPIPTKSTNWLQISCLPV